MSTLGSGRDQKPKQGASWLATYGDLVTLLMAFFVMLFAISSVEQTKFEAFLSGLAAFGNPAANDPTPEPIGEPVADNASQVIPPLLAAPAPLKELGERVQKAMAEAGLAGAVEVQLDRRGLALVVGTDDVLFASGSAQVTPRGRRIIATLAPELVAVSNEIDVEGHTDTVPLDRNGYTNWNLSTDRAVAVVNVLASEHGVPPTRLTASGHSEYVPRDVGTTAEARRRNRRVEIVILNPGSAPSGVSGTGSPATATDVSPGPAPGSAGERLADNPVGLVDIRPDLRPSGSGAVPRR